ncbi:MAG: DNA/RNA non-specific endonuclease [Bacteroidetes bacterium]|jgi:endonuclease G|nr:DNA/RNA non-specific endonuclease [Bacteroidota bacterium]MBP7257242.1 DNA/RNA non-specific endonuclease [Chitinophagales bacterium]MBK7138616.1 DNA/RNA non-specific endonuclease [Bacteroidota bacterium]MBK7641367.1 DNA/RNA non-specific endonuclease [Bacteroidota bacterium]MBK8673499.1 DNA/RNA non-specific endonuclease [Bacteroidota bacterium]
MKKICLLLAVWISFYGNNSFAQIVTPKIDTLNNVIVSQKKTVEEIFKEVEVLKLLEIQKKIKEIALPTPIQGEEIVNHSAYTLSYNDEHEQPNWVVHMVTKDILYGAVSRTNDFRPDPNLKCGSMDSVDYWNSGFDRGHLAPSADFRWSLNALSESYYYSNMSPQVADLNRGAWSKLENQGREWSLDCNELFVVTGPVLKPNLPKVQQGSFRLSIPEYYYKIFVDLYGPEYKAIAFIMPNKKIDDPIMNYVVSIDEIEKKTGIDFFPTLDDSLEERLEKKSIVEEWPASVQSTSAAAVPINFEKGQIGTAQVKYFFGETATVCGQVVATKYKINGKSDPTYINLDKKWPETVFTLMVFGKDRINFSYKPEEFLTDKKICVTGKVGEFNGTPQIIATDETQIQIME